MSATVGTSKGGTTKHTGGKEKPKSDRHTSQQKAEQLSGGKNDSHKVQPTQEQLRMAEMAISSQTDVNEHFVKQLMDMTGRSEDDVVIALHDAENDLEKACDILLDSANEHQNEWKEQSGKRKKKGNTSSHKQATTQNGEQLDGQSRDRGDRDFEKEKEGGNTRQEGLPRTRGRGRRNDSGPPPRLARRGKDRANFNKERNVDDWDNDRGDSKSFRNDNDRNSGSDRGRPRGRGGFGRRGGREGGGRGRFNNADRGDRFNKINNQIIDGPEIDTWTNETAETKPSKDADWNNWNESWVNEDDQWTGTLEETKVFTPSMKIDSDPVLNEPPSSLGQRLDVVSLFSESAKFPKAPDYSKPSGDAFINQFNQAATESIKNTIGIGSGSRPSQSMNSMAISSHSAMNSLGLSTLTQDSQGGLGGLGGIGQQTQLAQISQSMSGQTGMVHSAANVRDQGLGQSRIPSVLQQSRQQASIGGGGLPQRSKPQRTKLPPPSTKIPASAVEMPSHLARNPALDLQFGAEFSAETGASFGFGSTQDSVATSDYSTTSNGASSVISNHRTHVGKTDGSSLVSSIMASPSAGNSNQQSSIEVQQQSRQGTIFHSAMYNSSPPKSESQTLDREQISDSIPFSTPQLDRKSSPLMPNQHQGQTQNLNSGTIASLSKTDASNVIPDNYSASNGYSVTHYQNHQKITSQNQPSFSSNSQPSQPGSSFPGQYQASQSGYPTAGPNQFGSTANVGQFPPGQAQFSNQYQTGPGQFSSTGSVNIPSMPLSNHQSQYSGGNQSNFSSSGQSQYSSYQNTSFPSHPPSQTNYMPPNPSGGANNSIYPVSTQSNASFSTSQPNTYQSPPSGGYHSRDTQTGITVSTQSNSVGFPSQVSTSNLKQATTQSGPGYSSQTYSSTAPLQPSSLTSKLGESLSKMTLKDNVTLDVHQSSQYGSSSTTTMSSMTRATTATTAAALSTSTSTISSTSTMTSVTTTSRIASMPSTSKAPPNLPPGVPVVGHQFIMGQSTMPPYISVQPPMYGYEDLQLLQQRMPMQTGNYYDMGAFPASAGSTMSTGREQQQQIPNVSFSGATADTSKIARVDAQSPNASSQTQNAHNAAQQPLMNFHYGYYYHSMFPGATLQYPMFPVPPVTNAPGHAGTTATTQFQKNFPPQIYTSKGYDEVNQAQDFSKTGYGSSQSSGKTTGTRMSTRTGTSDLSQSVYKSHSQGFDKQGFQGATPPPYNLPLAAATQAGPMGAPTTPYGAPFLPMMAAHQPHSPMMHHPIQQDSNSTNSRVNQSANQGKTGTKAYGGPPYWAN